MIIASAEPDLTTTSLLVGRQLRGKNRDEDDVVDPEDHLEGRQRQQCDPCLGVSQPIHAGEITRSSPERWRGFLEGTGGDGGLEGLDDIGVEVSPG